VVTEGCNLYIHKCGRGRFPPASICGGLRSV
jgi:hypothetical protein